MTIRQNSRLQGTSPSRGGGRFLRWLIRVTCAACVLDSGDEDVILQVDDIVHDDDTDNYNVDRWH